MKLTLLALMTSILLQVGTSSPRDLLNLQRPLTPAEMDAVVSGVREALAGVTLRLVPDREAGYQVLMGRAGMPRMIRSEGAGERIATITTVTGDGIARTVRNLSVPERFVSLIEYTGVPARRCNGATATGEMVLEYRLHSTTQMWTATARESGPADIRIARPLEMLRTTASLSSGETRRLGTRSARAIVSRSTADTPLLTGDPAPNPAEFVPVQSLWIDASSLLPLRWELSQRQAIVGEVDFVYEPLEFQRPANVEVPACIS